MDKTSVILKYDYIDKRVEKGPSHVAKNKETRPDIVKLRLPDALKIS